MTTCNNLQLEGFTIRQDSEGRYCLNDLHNVVGGLDKNRPSVWALRKPTQDLIREIKQGRETFSEPLVRQKGGNRPRTCACLELVYDYAMWISPEFHRRVVRAFEQQGITEDDSSYSDAKLPVVRCATMSSLEIAALTGKRHGNVLADIRNMLDALGNDCAEFSAQYRDASGKSNRCYLLPKDLSLTLVTGYSIPLRHKINQRWLELEGNQVQAPQPSQPQLPDFRDPIAAAEAWLGYHLKPILSRQLAAPKEDPRLWYWLD